MARQQVLAKVDAVNFAAANDFLASLYGDPAGTVEISLNASATGAAPATHSVSNSNLSDAEANSWQAWLAARGPGCDSYSYPTTTTIDGWAKAQELWGLQPVR